MKKIYIPKLNETVTLAEDWTFILHAEARNLSLLQHLFPNSHWRKYHNWGRSLDADDYIYEMKATLPKGTELTFNRYYIRQNKENYDSITFTIKKNGILGNKAQLRFWAKLDDVNKIIFQE